MNQEKLTFEDAIEALAAAHISGHPQPYELIAYHQGLMEATARERIGDHLALCRECASAVLDLGAFPSIPTRRSVDCQEADQTRTWKAILAELKPAATPKAVYRLAPLWRYAAACLALVALLQGFWIYRLREQAAGQGGPRGDVYVDDISSVVRRNLNPDTATVVPAGMDRVLWILDPGPIENYPRYLARVARQDAPERILWEQDLTPLPEQSFTLLVSRQSLPSGRYIIEVFGVRGAERVLLATIRRNLQYSTD